MSEAGPPGTGRARRFVPRFHWELIVCGLRGHELVGLDAAELRPEDAIFARDAGETRWYRCLRCDSWLPLQAPAAPATTYPAPRDEIELPLRGRPLRDKIVLRLIAVDRALHFLILAVVAAAIFVFAANRGELRGPAYRVLADLQSGMGGAGAARHGILYDIHRLFSINTGTLTKIGVIVAAYAALEGVEAVGLWLQRRWAEYLTFIATTVFIPLEVYELSHRVSVLKVLTLIINLAVVAYLLWAKRLFGVRGGTTADEAERARDVGWAALERSTPAAVPS
jgi:uncharacterized membrane protein (DUF2068 family)